MPEPFAPVIAVFSRADRPIDVMQHVGRSAKHVGVADLDDRNCGRRPRTVRLTHARCANGRQRPARLAFDDATAAQRRVVRDRWNEVVVAVRCDDQLHLRCERVQQREDVAARGAVEPVGEFIEHEYRGLAHERPGDQEPAQLPK